MGFSMGKPERKPKLDIQPAFVPRPLPTEEKRVQKSIWFLPSIFKQIQHEAIDRGMSVAEVFEEAVQARVMLINKDPK